METLTPNERNPRTITDEQLAILRETLKRFGDLGGIVKNRTSGKLVGGHQRIKAFESDPDAELVVTEQVDPPDEQGTVAIGHVLANGTRYGYREVAWDEATEAAAMLAANKVGGDWDWQGVSELLKDIKGWGGEINLTGFESHELENLLAADWKVPEVNDTAPEASEGEQKMDKVYLTPGAREALDAAKTLLNEADDAKAIERVCLAYKKGTKKK